MKLRFILASLAVGVCSSSVGASGICFEPRAPSIGFVSQPRKPYCQSTSKGCSQWEIDSYRRDVQRYFETLRTYVADVDKYRKEAYEYAKCMADLD